MPVFAADVLPDTTGRNLGNPSQLWNANLQSLNVVGTSSLQPVSGQSITPGGAIYVATSPVTVSANITTGQNLCIYTVPAYLLNATGKVLRGTMGGTYTTQAGQTPTFAIAVLFGSLQVFVVQQALSASQSNASWRAQWEFIVYTPGSAAQLDTHGSMGYQNSAGNHLGTLLVYPNVVVGPIDLTAAQALVCYCVFSTNTSPANVCTQREFIVEVLN